MNNQRHLKMSFVTRQRDWLNVSVCYIFRFSSIITNLYKSLFHFLVFWLIFVEYWVILRIWFGDWREWKHENMEMFICKMVMASLMLWIKSHWGVFLIIWLWAMVIHVPINHDYQKRQIYERKKKCIKKTLKVKHL